jgi:hypothetical protein
MLASVDACIETARCPLSKIHLEANGEESTEIGQVKGTNKGETISDGGSGIAKQIATVLKANHD